MTARLNLLTIGDCEARARQTMTQALFDRLFGDLGAPDWITNTPNVPAMSEVKLRHRILVDVTERDLTAIVLGEEISMPALVAPTGAPSPWASWLLPRPPPEPSRGSAPPPAAASRRRARSQTPWATGWRSISTTACARAPTG
jgi:hypothetical protein